jgi:AraC-like DNA-binding protein
VEFPEHVHGEASIVICTKGCLESSQFGVKTLLHAGEILVTNRNTKHSSRYSFDGEACEGVTIDLDASAAEKLVSLDPSGELWNLNQMRMLGLQNSERIKRQALELRERVSGDQEGLEDLAVRICLDVLRVWPDELVLRSQGEDRAKVNLLPRWEFIRAIEHLYQQSAAEIHWEKLAQHLEREPGQLAKSFRDTTGSDPQRCFERVLMNRAVVLQEQSNLSYFEVARELGFRSFHQFRRVMSRQHGGTPV